MEFNLDMFSFWQQGDSVSHAVLILLVVMSITSWTIILSKSVQLAWWLARNGLCPMAFSKTAIRTMYGHIPQTRMAGVRQLQT